MAIRTPLYYNTSTGNLQNLTTAEINEIVNHVAYRWTINPTISLSVTNNSSSNLSAMQDTRWSAGTVSNSNRAFIGEATTQEPQLVTVTYQKILQTISSISIPTQTLTDWPAYFTSGGNIQAMSLQDMKDTFFHPAIDIITSASTTSSLTANTYTISSSSSISNHTLVSATPVYVDTRTDLTLYSAAGIPEALDQPITINNYYLHNRNTGSDPGYTKTPVFIKSDGNIQIYDNTAFTNKLTDWIKYLTVNSADGYRIRYDINGVGNVRGSTMVNSIVGLTNLGNYQTLQVGDDYRSQEFPADVPVATANTYNLTINKI
jgi:hypothetical protein